MLSEELQAAKQAVHDLAEARAVEQVSAEAAVAERARLQAELQQQGHAAGQAAETAATLRTQLAELESAHAQVQQELADALQSRSQLRALVEQLQGAAGVQAGKLLQVSAERSELQQQADQRLNQLEALSQVIPCCQYHLHGCGRPETFRALKLCKLPPHHHGPAAQKQFSYDAV